MLSCTRAGVFLDHPYALTVIQQQYTVTYHHGIALMRYECGSHLFRLRSSGKEASGTPVDPVVPTAECHVGRVGSAAEVFVHGVQCQTGFAGHWNIRCIRLINGKWAFLLMDFNLELSLHASRFDGARRKIIQMNAASR